MRLEFGKQARKDLRSLFVYIAKAADMDIAVAYDGRIRAACDNILSYPDGGTPRDDLRKGARTIAFERRVVTVYEVNDSAVRILRIVYGGRDLGGMFRSIRKTTEN